MNTKLSRNAGRDAAVLLTSLIILTVAAVMLGSYLCLVQFQSSSVARSQSWNSIIPVSEAGIEEAMAVINGTNTLLDPTGLAWTNTCASDGWSSFSNGVTTSTRYVYSSNYYIASVDISGVANGNGPTITAAGYNNYNLTPWVFSLWKPATLPGRLPCFFAAVGSPSLSGSATIGRTIQVKTIMVPLFTVGLACKNSFNMNSKNCLVNSFDSGTATYSTPVALSAPYTNYAVNIYDTTKTKAGGDVGVDAAVLGDASLGNGTINGHLYTGPGDVLTDVQLGTHGTVGDLTWSAGNSGIEGNGTPTNWWQPTFNVNFADVKAPPLGVALPAPLTNGLFNGYISIPQGSIATNYFAASGFSTPLLVTGPTALWVQGSMTLPSIVIAPTNNARLILYVGTATGSGDSVTLGGSATANQPGYARNLQIFGLPSLNTMDLHGNAGWNATVYAPDADFTGGGGGNNTQDTQGSLVCRSFTAGGNWNFHFDESLKVNGPNRGWVANGWTEK